MCCDFTGWTTDPNVRTICYIKNLLIATQQKLSTVHRGMRWSRQASKWAVYFSPLVWTLHSHSPCIIECDCSALKRSGASGKDRPWTGCVWRSGLQLVTWTWGWKRVWLSNYNELFIMTAQSSVYCHSVNWVHVQNINGIETTDSLFKSPDSKSSIRPFLNI